MFSLAQKFECKNKLVDELQLFFWGKIQVPGKRYP